MTKFIRLNEDNYILGDIVLNHPDVRPTMEKGDHYISNEVIVSLPRNVVLANDWMVAVFLYKAEGIYLGHIGVMPQARGKVAVEGGKSALDRLFREFGARRVEARIPLQLRQARFYVKKVGFVSDGIDADGVYENFSVEAERWAA